MWLANSCSSLRLLRYRANRKFTLFVSYWPVLYKHWVWLADISAVAPCQSLMDLRYTVHVTCNLHKSDKFRGTTLQIPVNCCTASRRTFVFSPRNVCALSEERLCSVQRTSILCPKNVSALSTECLCSVHASVTKKTILPKLLIVVTERKSPNDSQNASRSNSRHLIHRSFSAIPWTLLEVSADSSWGVQTLCKASADASRITVLCHTRIHRLPMQQFCGEK